MHDFVHRAVRRPSERDYSFVWSEMKHISNVAVMRSPVVEDHLHERITAPLGP